MHYAAPVNECFSGPKEIEANIAKVNEENIQKAGLQFRAGSMVPNHNSVQAQWQVIAPNGQAVGGGRDFLLLDDDGRISALYMFMGQ